jgi:hypothetical protein
MVTTVAVASCLRVRSTTRALMSLRRRLPIGRRPSIGTSWLRTWLSYIASVLGRHCWAASQRGAYSASVVLPSAGDAQPVQGLRAGPGQRVDGQRAGLEALADHPAVDAVGDLPRGAAAVGQAAGVRHRCSRGVTSE